MAKWFESNKERFDLERKLLHERGFVLDEGALKERGRVEFCGVINDGHTPIDIRIICEEGFPYRIPLFIAPNLKLTPQTRHIAFRTRMICLRSAKPLEWSSEEHIVDLIPNAERVLRGQHTHDFGEEHLAPDQDLFGVRSFGLLNAKNHVIIPDDLLSPPDASLFTISISKSYRDRLLLAFQAGQKKTAAKFGIGADQDQFTVFRLREMPLESIGEFDTLFSYPNPNYDEMLRRYAADPGAAINRLDNLKRRGKETYFGIVFPYQTGWFWQFFKLQRVHKKLMSILPVGTAEMGSLSARISGILNVDRLSKTKVLIAGCGGIGSTVAVEMACAGVGTLFLNDGETVSVSNVIRHECSLANLGDRKSDAVKFKIAAKNPLTNVVADTEIFSDPEFERKVSESDLVVCAIGDYNTDAYINQLCVKHRKPMVFAYVGVYGAMGHVVRLSVQDGETGCFRCFRRHLTAKGIPDLPEIADINAVTVELGCNNPSLPAPSFDQRTISLIAVRKAIQWLDPWSYADDNADAIVFYARHLDGVVDEQSLKTEKFSVPALEDCPICGGGARQ